MSDAGNVAKSLRDRLGANTEDRLGRALSELLENPLLTGAIGRAFDAREKAAQAQEVAMGALNIPSAADIERLTRRLRAVSHRLEAIEDGVDRLDRALTPTGVDARLDAIEAKIESLGEKIDRALQRGGEAPAAPAPRAQGARRGTGTARAGQTRRAKQVSAAKAAKAEQGRTAKATKAAKAARTPEARSRAARSAPGKM